VDGEENRREKSGAAIGDGEKMEAVVASAWRVG
jgi:hypothetical protein